ncbi:MAG TPA: porin [Acidiferrobacteraceae bacterium]|nr:porin [Acidiferrobacteraceae bacterium]
MNKKLLILAVGAALAAGSVTANAGMKIGGYANVSADSLNSGTTSGSYVSSNASNVVISGDTDLGDGLSAVFSAQTFLSFGSANNPPANSPYNDAGFQYDAFGNGDTYAGLKAGFGLVALGRNDTPMKILGRQVDLFGNEIGDSRNLTAGPMGANMWDQRPGHSVFYVSPDFGGVQIRAAYEAENSNGTTGAGNSVISQGPKQHMDDLSVTWKGGPVFAGVAYEKDSVAGLSSQPDSVRAAAALNFKPFKVTALVQHDSNLTAGLTSNGSRNVFGIGAAFSFIGDNTVKAQYYKAGNTAGISNTGAHMIDVGFDHAFSKKATVYVDYAKTTNQSAANYTAFNPGHGNSLATAPGQSPHGVSVGMIYTF